MKSECKTSFRLGFYEDTHILPLTGELFASVMSYRKKIDRDITGSHCIRHPRLVAIPADSLISNNLTLVSVQSEEYQLQFELVLNHPLRLAIANVFSIIWNNTWDIEIYHGTSSYITQHEATCEHGWLWPVSTLMCQCDSFHEVICFPETHAVCVFSKHFEF